MMQRILDLKEDISVLRNEIEYLKRRVAELERVNLFKANLYYNPLGYQNAAIAYVKGAKDEV